MGQRKEELLMGRMIGKPRPVPPNDPMFQRGAYLVGVNKLKRSTKDTEQTTAGEDDPKPSGKFVETSERFTHPVSIVSMPLSAPVWLCDLPYPERIEAWLALPRPPVEPQTKEEEEEGTAYKYRRPKQQNQEPEGEK
jgi:hypothetical protein